MKNRLANITRTISEQITGKILAVFCVTLVNEFNFTPEDAKYACEFSQEYWRQIIEKNVDVFSWCEDETGLDMRSFIKEEHKITEGRRR